MSTIAKVTHSTNDLQAPQSPEHDLLSSGDRRPDHCKPSAPSEKTSPPEVKYNHNDQPGVRVKPPSRACDSVLSSTRPPSLLPYIAATSSLLPAMGSVAAEYKTKAAERDRNKNCCTPDVKINSGARVKTMGQKSKGRREDERLVPMTLSKGKSSPKNAQTSKAITLQVNRLESSAQFQSRPEMYTLWSLLDFRDVGASSGAFSTEASSLSRSRPSFGSQNALQGKEAPWIRDALENNAPFETEEEAVGCTLIPSDCASRDQCDGNAEARDSDVSPKANITQGTKKHNEDERGKKQKNSRECITVELEDNKRRQDNDLEKTSSFNAEDYAFNKERNPHNIASSSENVYRSSPVDKDSDGRHNINRFRASSDHDFILNFMTRRQRSSLLNCNIKPEIPNNSLDNSTSAEPCGLARCKDSVFHLCNSRTFDTAHIASTEESQAENVMFEKFLQDMATKNIEHHPNAAAKLVRSEETSQEPCCVIIPRCRQHSCEQVACPEYERDFRISSNVLTSIRCTSNSEFSSNTTSNVDSLNVIQKSESCSRIHQERFTPEDAHGLFSLDENCLEKLKISLSTSYEIEGQFRRAECSVVEGQLSQHESKFPIAKSNDEEDQFSKVKSSREAGQNSTGVPNDEQRPFKQEEGNREVGLHPMSNEEDHGSLAQDSKVNQAEPGNHNDNTGCEKKHVEQNNISQESNRVSQSKMKESVTISESEMKELDMFGQTKTNESDKVSQSEAKAPKQDSSAGCLSNSHGERRGMKLESCNCIESTKRSIDPGRDEDSTHQGETTPKQAAVNTNPHERVSPRGNSGDGQTTPYANEKDINGRTTPHEVHTSGKTAPQVAKAVLNKQGPAGTYSEISIGKSSRPGAGTSGHQANCMPSMSMQSVHTSTSLNRSLGEAKRLQKLALPSGYSPWIRPSETLLPRVGAETPAVCGDPEIQSFHEQLSSSLQTFQPRVWRPLTPDLVHRPKEPCHGKAGGRCRLRKIRPTTASSGYMPPRQVISRAGSAKYLPHRPDTPRVGQGDFDTLSPDVISELISDTRPNTTTATYGASRKGRPHRNTLVAPRNRSPLVELLDTDFGVSSDDDCRGDLSNNDSLSDLERGSEPLVDRNRKAPDIRLRPDDLDNVYVPLSKKDMRRFDFDAEKNVRPEYEFRCPLPAELTRINLRHCAVNKVDWRCSGYAANVCDPLSQDFMDRLVEMERHQFKTQNWESKRSKRQRKKTPHGRRNASRQRDKRCCKLCLQPACVGDCPLKRAKPEICDNCRQQFCAGECSETAYEQRMRAPREDTTGPPPLVSGARTCKTCQGHSNARAINSSYAELGRPTSAMLTFSRGQGSAVVIRRPSSVDCAPSATNKSKRPTRQPKRPRGRNGLLPGKNAISNLSMSITELSLVQY